MKKVFLYAIMLSTAVLTSCYDTYIEDYDYTSVYFPYQTDVRTVVVGEGMSIKIGVDLGGITNNTKNRIVNYVLRNDLITDSVLSHMQNGLSYIQTAVSGLSSLVSLPTNYYTLSDNSKFIITSGQHCGTITLKADSTLFLSDPATIKPFYVLPLYISTADADSVLETKRYALIGLHYENMLFGNYWHGGVTIVKDPSGNPIDTIVYKTTVPCPENLIWTLKTVAPNSLVTNAFSNNVTGSAEFMLTLAGDKVTISNVAGSTYVVKPDGESSYNKAKLLQNRRIYLNYKYVNTEGNTCYAKDTLTFRNRIRDGVNEWQDENSSNY